MSHGVGPVFPRGSTVRVFDGVVYTLPQRRPMAIRRYRRKQRRRGKGAFAIPITFRPQDYWRKGRSVVLERYVAATGLTIFVEEVAPILDPGAEYVKLLPPGRVLLARTDGRGYAAVEPCWERTGTVWSRVRETNRGLAVTPPFTGYLAHELGHVFGLAHTSPGDAPDPWGDEHGVMDYVGSFGWEIPAWGGHDLAELTRLYLEG
ncbi:MAG: hypothetical protein ACRDHM_07390 [Actinomycetota bacterium]